jgi:signal transduction histidine kinase
MEIRTRAELGGRLQEGEPTMLHEFLSSQRDEIIERSKKKIALRTAPHATEAELSFGVALFFDQLTAVLKGVGPSDEEMNAAATKHGDEMLRRGFTIGQVVHDYGSVCQAVTEVAVELDAFITPDEFRTLNRCLDDGIAQAVTEYERLRTRAVSKQSTELIGTLAHEIRNRLSTAILSFGMLKNGDVSVHGSTGALLERSLKGLNDLVDRSLTEIRLESTLCQPERLGVAEFVEEVGVAAIMEAKCRGFHLTIDPVAFDVALCADRQLLAAAVSNLLQNAFKFTRKNGAVHLRTRVTADRVLMEIEDECGGLPPGLAERLFRPFTQSGTDRSGLGLGLSISRRAVQLNGGVIRVLDLPRKGCIFTVDLPRMTNEQTSVT